MGFDFSKRCKVTRVSASVAAGTSAVNSSIIDMANYDACCFLALLGDVLTTSVLTLTIEENSVNSGTGMAAVGNTTAWTADATNADSKILLADIRNPRERYLRAVLTRTTANAVVDGILAIQYNESVAPVTQASDVIAQVLLTSPSE